MSKRLCWLALALLLGELLFGELSNAAVTATVDRNQISEFDLLTLTVRVTDRANVEPDWQVLDKDFQLVNQQSQQNSSISLVNGRQTSRTYVDYQVTLRPRRQGNLVIPAIVIGTERTNPITIAVLPQSAALTNQMRQVLFFETLVDQTEIYVQAQLLYTVRLYYADSISGDFPAPPDLDNAVVEIIENEKRFETVVNNRRYYVLEKRYAIFPQASGTLMLPPESFVGTRGRGGLFSARERINASSEGHQIRVLPVPDSYQGQSWLPAQEVTLRSVMNKPDSPLVVGDAINQVITLQAAGVTGALLPELAYPDSSDARIYIDQPVIEEFASEAGIASESVLTIGIVPTAEGTLTLPALTVSWWDTQADKPRQTTLEGFSLSVGASPVIRTNQPLTPPSPPLSAPDNPQFTALQNRIEQLIWLVALVTCAWLATAFGWLRSNRTPKVVDSVVSIREYELGRLKRALKKHDAEGTLAELQHWRQAVYPEMQSLADVARLEPRLRQMLNDLEADRYRGIGGQHPWDPAALLSLIEALTAEADARTSPTSGLAAGSINPTF
ncbi:MAG: hypothetical protein CBC55_04210 [Gammaproteobacteria bacterium TMED95]|nr:hypothetical protein [Gammaproteobacteria bacterium]OUV22409.1 MAG: hypothetical protein CBC55_04210 [Gammaproteobacteria bacterium TMED95]